MNVVEFNSTTITAKEIVEIHTKQTYLDFPAYDGAWHPFDGWLAKTQLNLLLGYVLFVFSVVPNWLMMVGISFISRTFL